MRIVRVYVCVYAYACVSKTMKGPEILPRIRHNSLPDQRVKRIYNERIVIQLVNYKH